MLNRDRWIIDGFDNVALAWERFADADTLVQCRPANRGALLGDHPAPDRGPVPQPARLAGERAGMGKFARQLPRRRCVPSHPDATLSAAGGGRGGVEAGVPLALARRDAGVSPGCGGMNAGKS